MITAEEEEILIEAVAGAHRALGPDGFVQHAHWLDLDARGRERAFEVARGMRALEAAVDPGGLSATARAVMARIRGS
jgi:hypothetical protein